MQLRGRCRYTRGTYYRFAQGKGQQYDDPRSPQVMAHGLPASEVCESVLVRMPLLYSCLVGLLQVELESHDLAYWVTSARFMLSAHPVLRLWSTRSTGPARCHGSLYGVQFNGFAPSIGPLLLAMEERRED